MTFSIANENTISIKGIPKQWISLIDLFNTALPQFPLKYIHLIHDGERIFGFPVTYELSSEADGSPIWKFLFLSNIPLDDVETEVVKTELKQRLGAETPVRRSDIEGCCSENDSRRPLLLKIWDSFIIRTYGGNLPFGRFFIRKAFNRVGFLEFCLGCWVS